MDTWLFAGFLGLGLAAATGFRTFLPLLILSAVTHFHWAPITLNGSFAWLGSTVALVALAVATAVELVADKVPVVDNALSAIGTVTRPLAAILVTGAVFAQTDPAIAILAGIIVGAPTAFAIHSVQTGARAASTTLTGGLANPIVSVVEDVVAGVTAVTAILFPVMAPLIVGLLLYSAWRIWRALRARKRADAAPAGAPDA